jgi:hypothetical protein
MNLFRIATALALAPLLHAAPAAADTWSTCTGMITSVPAVIASPGIYCFDRDLSLATTSGVAIAVNAHHVTIDCNGYRLGNLAAGTATAAVGIQSTDRVNVVVKNCHIRGFAAAINLTGNVNTSLTSAGHVVEDNYIEAATTTGILLKGRNSVVRRNRVNDIGWNDAQLSVTGIAGLGTVDILDNIVAGVEPGGKSPGMAWGIYAEAVDGIVIARNEVRDVYPLGGFGWGLFVVGNSTSLSSLRDNAIHRTATSTLWARCTPGYTSVEKGNAALGWTTGSSDCYQFEPMETW